MCVTRAHASTGVSSSGPDGVVTQSSHFVEKRRDTEQPVSFEGGKLREGRHVGEW